MTTQGKPGHTGGRVSYMQMIFVGDNNASHTNLCSAMDTNADTLATFRSYRRLEVNKGEATFLLDYYNAKGDLSDTILLDSGGFTAITGEKPKSAAAYNKIDRDYWTKARAALSAAKGDAR